MNRSKSADPAFLPYHEYRGITYRRYANAIVLFVNPPQQPPSRYQPQNHNHHGRNRHPKRSVFHQRPSRVRQVHLHLPRQLINRYVRGRHDVSTAGRRSMISSPEALWCSSIARCNPDVVGVYIFFVNAVRLRVRFAKVLIDTVGRLVVREFRWTSKLS